MRTDTFIKYHMFTWKLCGIWHWPNEPLWYTVYSHLSMFVCHIIFPITLVIKVYNVESVFEKIEILMILPNCLAGLKGLMLCRDKKLIMETFATLRQLDDQIRPNEQKRMNIYGHRYFPLSIRFFYLLSCLIFSITPFLADERVLVWNSSWPFDYANSTPIYYSILVYQSISTYAMTTILSSTDIFGATIYDMISAHLNILANRLSAIGWDKKLMLTSQRENQGPNTYNDVTISWQRQCEHELQECIELHLKCHK